LIWRLGNLPPKLSESSDALVVKENVEVGSVLLLVLSLPVAIVVLFCNDRNPAGGARAMLVGILTFDFPCLSTLAVVVVGDEGQFVFRFDTPPKLFESSLCLQLGEFLFAGLLLKLAK
jgi:hypothetical protein